MCKLFAYINHETRVIPTHIATAINKALKHLFYINSYGQVDGSGIMWMDAKGNADYMKAPVPSTYLMDFADFRSISPTLYKNKFVAGHTRFSTVGSNTWENSHPFEHGRYLGIQNGTISNDHETLVQGKVSPCEVDSASVFWAFDQQGVDKTMANYEGEGVFMFLDTKDKTFNIVKNIYRNLHKAKVVGYEIYLVTTDAYALDLVAQRSGLVIENPYEVKDDTLITYSLDNNLVTRKLVVPEPWSSYLVDDTSSTYSNNYGTSKTIYPKKIIGKGDTSSKHTKTKGDIKPKKKQSSGSDTTTGVIPFKLTDTTTYLTDCQMCGNPIHQGSLVFGDNDDPSKADYVTCSCCAADVTEWTGRPMYKLTHLKPGDFNANI